jgi:sulfur carrier protein ThiS
MPCHGWPFTIFRKTTLIRVLLACAKRPAILPAGLSNRGAVKLYVTLSDYLPAGSKNSRVEIDVAENAAVDAVLAPFLLPAKLMHLVLINGVFVPPDERATTALREGDVLAVWPPIAGG